MSDPYAEYAGWAPTEPERKKPKVVKPRHKWVRIALEPRRERSQCVRCGISRVTTTLADSFPAIRYYLNDETTTERAPACNP